MITAMLIAYGIFITLVAVIEYINQKALLLYLLDKGTEPSQAEIQKYVETACRQMFQIRK